MFKFRLSTQRYGEECCVFAWCLEEGFTESFYYARRREVLSGIFSDSPDLSGARTAGGGGGGNDDHNADSVGSMMCCAWWNLLRELEDTQPNADQEKCSIQLDTISEAELYEEYVTCVSDANVAACNIIEFQTWKSLWKKHFPEVTIVEVKNLLSKVWPSAAVMRCTRPSPLTRTLLVTTGPCPPSAS